MEGKKFLLTTKYGKQIIFFLLILTFLILGGILALNLKQKTSLVACPEIAPACGNSKEECLKSAESLEKQYPGCQYANICESCKYKEIEKPTAEKADWAGTWLIVRDKTKIDPSITKSNYPFLKGVLRKIKWGILEPER